MRAQIIERASGAVVATVEAETTYGLWTALLDWGEARGVPRFQVPTFYRTARIDAAEAATPVRAAPKPKDRTSGARPARPTKPAPAAAAEGGASEPAAMTTRRRRPPVSPAEQRAGAEPEPTAPPASQPALSLGLPGEGDSPRVMEPAPAAATAGMVKRRRPAGAGREARARVAEEPAVQLRLF